MNVALVSFNQESSVMCVRWAKGGGGGAAAPAAKEEAPEEEEEDMGFDLFD